MCIRDSIDTLEVSGNVLAAADLEPVKGMMVGLHADLSDSAFVKKPFDRVSRKMCIRDRDEILTEVYSNTSSLMYRNLETRMIAAYYDSHGILWIA